MQGTIGEIAGARGRLVVDRRYEQRGGPYGLLTACGNMRADTVPVPVDSRLRLEVGVWSLDSLPNLNGG
jgi:hypothetical protein